MADKALNTCISDAVRIATISYFDDTEPTWDERPYFSLMETARGREGIHLEISGEQSFRPLILPDRIYPYPGADETSLRNSIRFAEAIGIDRYRVILSGIGGDELLGGVPTPFPELSDYLARGNFWQLLMRGTQWSVALRQPLISTLQGSCSFLWNAYRQSDEGSGETPPWMTPRTLFRRFVPLQTLEAQPLRMFLLPSALSTARGWWRLVKTLPNQVPSLIGCYEYRFPYLDRDLVDFAIRLPREQLVTQGRRRLLMRRALKGIVPAEILERRRKAVISRSPITSLRDGYSQITALFRGSLLGRIGLLSDRDLINEVDKALHGNIVWLAHLHRTIFLELWLRSVSSHLAMP
jgi:asparagine synthase (glutamine-hydrolysing)